MKNIPINNVINFENLSEMYFNNNEIFQGMKIENNHVSKIVLFHEEIKSVIEEIKSLKDYQKNNFKITYFSYDT